MKKIFVILLLMLPILFVTAQPIVVDTVSAVAVEAVSPSAYEIFWKDAILGGIPIWDYLLTLLIVILVLVFRHVYKVYLAVRSADSKTPMKFNFKFWLADNIIPILLMTVWMPIGIFLLVRFAPELIGVPWSQAVAIVIGLGFTYFIDKLNSQNPFRKALKSKSPYAK